MTNEGPILKEINANYTQSENRTIGGLLTVTAKAIKFSPNKVDELTGGKELYIPVEDIESVGVEEKFSNGVKNSLTNGGLRDRLRIKHKDSQRELFVVSNLDKVINDIQSVVNDDTENLSQDSENPELGSLLLKGVAYLLGGIALFLGVRYLASSDIVVGMLLLFAGIIGTPYTRKRAGETLGVQINKWTATILFILCWITASQLLA